MIVMKFGGTSIRDAEWIDRALDITAGQIHRAPVLVASAMGKTTDLLQQTAHHAGAGEENQAFEIVHQIERAHRSTVESFLTNTTAKLCLAHLDKLFGELTATVMVLCRLKEWTRRANDVILSFGERLSTTIIAARCTERKIRHLLLDSREVVKTDENFTEASPIFEIANRKIRENVKPEAGNLIIMQGFIGSTETGVTTTLGRGGSDYSATIIGAALEVEEVQIWTDVDGIMTCDPKLVENPVTVAAISYQEAAELAYFGARVIHPSTIQPAVSSNIPVSVRNTGKPNLPGTRIVANTENAGLKAIAFKKEITVINITSSRMLLAYGFMRRIFEIFEKYETGVDLIATSEVSVSVTIDDTTSLDQLQSELSEVGSVVIEKNMSIICLVGQELWKSSSFLARVFASLESIPIRIITLGASDVNLSFVVAGRLTEAAVRKLHDTLFRE